MIGRLKGVILEKHPPQLLIDVNGVGYEVQASMNTFYQLPDIGKEIIVYTHLVVREDAQDLYAFHNSQERHLFRTLIKVSGVGPKMALAILSSMDPNAFVVCVNNHDVGSLTRIPGVGKKTAERLVVEMEDRLAKWNLVSDVSDVKATGLKEVASTIIQDAMSALIALGYKPQEASKAVSKINAENFTSEELIKLALQQIG